MCETSNLDYRTILRNAQAKGIDPSLEPVQQMLRELGDPDLAFRAIQVAGTNGKTSTARYTAAILAGEGLKVGLYLSPMLMDYLDQIEVEGQTIDEVELSSAVIDAWQAGQRVNARREELGLSELPLTEFDLLTVAAVLVFCRRGVDVAVLEAGMGGQWDATSAVRSINTVGVTGIGLDHTRILGTTLAQIAQNKAAVIQAGRACVLGPGTQSDPEVAEVFERRCAEQQVEPVIVGEDSAGAKNVDAIYKAEMLAQDKGALRVSVCTTIATYTDLQAPKPRYQAQNIACALVLSQVFLGRTLNVDALRASVRECRTPGRFDILRTDPLVLVDACHNPQSVQAFLDAWCSLYPNAIPTAHSAPT
ncbi:MAG: Mur ligase family protein, partial [Coriobacteriales bacterium]|nr:Mur ligase family protein [Coriobacteriales bacterium]